MFTNELEAVDAALELFLMGFKDFSGSNESPVDFGPLAVYYPLPIA